MNHAEKADSLVALPGIYQGKPCKGGVLWLVAIGI